jgi:RimJ/RimL family protein N-acetyltransferase
MNIKLPANYPAEWIETIALKDRGLITIRPIRPDDAPRLQHGYMHLSPQSIYYRFLETPKELTDEMAQRFASLDYQNQMALVATIEEDGEEHLVGVARYVLIGDQDPGAAETAIIVRDDYQGRGLGTLLYERLIQYARSHQVTTFVGTVHQSNSPMLKFIHKSGLQVERRMDEPGVFQVRVKLA